MYMYIFYILDDDEDDSSDDDDVNGDVSNGPAEKRLKT